MPSTSSPIIGTSRARLASRVNSLNISTIRDLALFNDQERIVMRYALEATMNVAVSEATFQALHKSLDTRRLMEVVQNVAFYNMVVRILVPLKVEVEPGVKKL